jgi:WD40 repeat protein/energy-coupling factor transporter ATP-binding protein EcfA2
VARVFVSHASEDREYAGQLHQWLDAEGHEVFLDQDLRDGILVGDEWDKRLHERLRWADAVICVVTSAAVASTWCSAEVGIALSRGSRLLPVRAEPGVDHPLLTSAQYADLTVGSTAGRAALLEALRRVDAAGGLGWPDDRSPFPGLRPFDVEQHRVFFGRVGETEEIAELLRSPAERAKAAALLVVGPSGCGKSSLVRAGLLHVMAEEPGWLTLSPILPGADPVVALARELAATARRSDLDWTVDYVHHQLAERGLVGLADELLLANQGGPLRRLLIVVDQFEELFTQASSGQRARFGQLLAPALWGPVQVVATLRPEFLDQLLVDADLAVLPTRPFTLRPLLREALGAVIEGPARVAGIAVVDELVGRLVADTSSGEALPLLAFTLAQLAHGVGRGGQLSSALYDQLGGVQGALTRQADAALVDATMATGRPREEVIDGLLRLVTVDEQGRPTRSRVDRAQLPEPVTREVDIFVSRRLLITRTDDDKVVVEVAHEAFLSAWPPLAQAIDENVTALKARRAVEQAATEWDDDGRPPNRLWERSQLAAAVTDTGARLCVSSASSPALQSSTSHWLSRRRRMLVTDRVDVSPKARTFLHTSIRRDRYRRRRTTTILSVLLIVALVGLGFAVIQQRAAQEQQRIAIARQLITQADAIRETDPRTALLLGIAAERIRPGGETRASLANTLTTTRYAGTFADHAGPVTSVAFSPDGATLAVGDSDGTAILWNLADPSRPRQSLTAHAGSVSSVAFSPDGRTLATGSFDGRVILWNLADPVRPRQFLVAYAGSMFSVAFSPDGRTLAAGDSDGTVILWDVADPTRRQQLGSLHTGRVSSVFSVAFSPDGRTLATASDDGTATLWNLADPARPQHSLVGHTSSVNSVAFSPDGRTLATASDDGTATLWDLTDMTRLQPLRPALTSHTSRVTAVAFAPDGRTLATASDDGTATLWDLTDMTRLQPLRPALTSHTSRVTAVAFAPDGRALATASSDATVILWDLTDRAQPQRLGQPLTGQASPVDSVVFAPDGRTLTVTSSDGIVVLWDLSHPDRPRQRQSRTRPSSPVDSLALAPDGLMMVTASDDGRVILWDLTDRTQPRPLGQPLTGHRGLVTSAAFSADGLMMVTASDDGRVILWDLTDRTQPRPLGQPLTGHRGSVTAVALSPDGKILATGGSDTTVILWNLTDLNQLRDHAMERACFITGRGLDGAEWSRYIPGLPYQDTCHLTTARGDGSR